jgi:hypothetical protein
VIRPSLSIAEPLPFYLSMLGKHIPLVYRPSLSNLEWETEGEVTEL